MKERTKGVIMIIVLALVLAGIGVWMYFGSWHSSVPGPKDISLGLDLAGGVSVTYQTVKEDPSRAEMEDIQTKLEKRATALSTESHVYIEGSRRINVDIPGIDDAEKVFNTLGNAGNIYFIYTQDSEGNSNIIEDTSAESGYRLARPMADIIAAGCVVVDGKNVTDAQGVARQNSQTSAIEYMVQLTLDAEGAKKFAEGTEKCAGYPYGSLQRKIAIIYDDVVYSAPNVNEKIEGGEAVITGSRTMDEANDLATIIRIGALPLELSVLRSNVVGATLGSRALETGLIAGLIGFILVCIYMIIFYRVPGLAACLSLVTYLGIGLALLLICNVTLTLPGIAGIILSIGMAVDANVIIFTRIKEELATGKTVRSAVKIGYRKALSAIVDGNVTTLIAAIVLYFKGTGVIKGFATTLGIGILVSMFTALVVTNLIMRAFYYIGIDNEKAYGVAKKPKTLRIVQNWKKYVAISGAVIILCVTMLIVNSTSTGNALNYGLDFVGGSSIQVTFDNTVPSNSEMEAFVKDTVGEKATVAAVKGSNALVLKTVSLSEDNINKLKKELNTRYGVAESNIETETISGTVSGEMKTNAFVAVIIATVCMLLYIWIRFKNVAFASSSVLALVHDILVVLCVYAVAKLTVDTNFIACMLTIVGYSINATIVIFDRLRENMAEMKGKDSLADVVNRSISETLTRSIHTSITTLITVVMLIILGVESIRIFAIPMAVGILCGGYSSVCLAGTMWYFIKTKLQKKEKVRA
ncbi:MAG: protein translocase subunit SecD [Lachnospiraceae bacterium]|nr:protein translocase subunit SecD [Lachnospiraceae bacterium]